jgi:hypothetical protein
MSYFPTHRSRTQKKRGRVAAAAAVILGSVLAFSSPAAGFTNFTEAIVSDGNSIGRCALTLTNANYTTHTVRANINASVKPAATPDGIYNNTHVRVECLLYSQGFGALLKYVSSQQQGAYTSTSNISTQPLSPDYIICTRVTTTLRAGPTSSAGYVCAP